jgi:hypothetical protein
MYTLKKLALLLLFFLYVKGIYAQEKFTLNGYIKDSLSGETLISANITLKEAGKGVTSNQYGFFSLTLPKGNYQLQVSYVGYISKLIEVNFESNRTIDVLLVPISSYLNNVTVITGKRESNTKSAQMGKIDLDINTIKS